MLQLKQKLFLILTTSVSFISFSQVGIGNTTPAATLEITAANPTGAATTVDGIVIPRVDRQRALAMTTASIPNSTIIFVNSIATGTATGKAINITSTGFYYFDTVSNTWIKLQTGTPTSDWSLTGNAGTTAGTNFIGTTDAQDFRIKTGVGGVDRWNISNTNNGQLQSYSLGTAALPNYSYQGDPNTGLFSPAADNISLSTNGVEKVRVQSNGSMTIGSTYAAANAAPANGLRVEGNSVIGKASGEDTRDVFSTHTSATSFSNIIGYPNVLAKRAISGYADASGIGVLGYATSTGYGVIGLTQAGVLSGFVQTGEGILGQADGAAAGIPIGNHGIIDETVAGNNKATGILGENNNITKGTGLGGGAYNPASISMAGVYGNFATRSSASDAYQFGVVGDVLLLGVGTQPDATGGVLGTIASGSFGVIGYKSMAGTNFSVYGGLAAGSIAVGNTGRSANSTPNNSIGLGINGGFMGGYVKGNQYGLVSKGDEFGMYVQGNTIVNNPIVQLTETDNSERTATYLSSSTEVDITTRGVGQLRGGYSFVSFKDSFKNLTSTSEPINITITPMGETNGVYVSEITKDGFYVKENLKGTSNASFNWTAIGTKKGFENGVAISSEILSSKFDKNIEGTMSNDGSKQEGTPIYFDGNKVKFERIPDGLLKESKKAEPKK